MVVGRCIRRAYNRSDSGLLAPHPLYFRDQTTPRITSESGHKPATVSGICGTNGTEFDAKGQVEAIRPDLYPNILESTPFALAVLYQPVTLRSKRPLPLYQLLAETAWPFAIDSRTPLPKPTDQPIRLTKPQRELIEDLKSLIKADLDPQNGHPDYFGGYARLRGSYSGAQFSADYLQAFVRAYRTDKAAKREFAQQQMEAARRIVDKLERDMLANQDETRFLSLPSASLLNRRLSSQYAAADAIYQELKREHSKAIIQVQAVTPVFKVLEPAQVPDRRSSPRRLLIVLAGGVSALVIVALVCGREAFGDDSPPFSPE